jgi:hypothetical protein
MLSPPSVLSRGLSNTQMNVTGAEFRAYLETFHTTLAATAAEYLPSDVVGSLFHLSFQPCQIRGYVSTQFGVAFEYVPSSTGIDIVMGCRRIEDLFLDRPTRFERQFPNRGCTMMLRDGALRITLNNVSFTNQPSPFHLDGPNTHVTLISCHFDALGWSRDVVGAEIFGNRAISFWSRELAIGRAKDEVLAALVDLGKAAAHRIPIAEYANTKKQKNVLVLGDYSTDGLKRLEAICECVLDLGYEPILMKDVPDIFGSDLQQKVGILGSLARFVLIDDSSRSGHLVEVPIAQQNRWLTVLLHAKGERGSFMTAGLPNTSNVIIEQDFDPSAPRAAIERSIAWAESQLRDLEGRYKGLYPWR